MLTGSLAIIVSNGAWCFYCDMPTYNVCVQGRWWGRCDEYWVGHRLLEVRLVFDKNTVYTFSTVNHELTRSYNDCCLSFSDFTFICSSFSGYTEWLPLTVLVLTYKNWGSDVEMFEILPRDWILKPILTQKWAFVNMNWGFNPPLPNPRQFQPCWLLAINCCFIL